MADFEDDISCEPSKIVVKKARRGRPKNISKQEDVHISPPEAVVSSSSIHFETVAPQRVQASLWEPRRDRVVVSATQQQPSYDESPPQRDEETFPQRTQRNGDYRHRRVQPSGSFERSSVRTEEALPVAPSESGDYVAHRQEVPQFRNYQARQNQRENGHFDRKPFVRNRGRENGQAFNNNRNNQNNNRGQRPQRYPMAPQAVPENNQQSYQPQQSHQPRQNAAFQPNRRQNPQRQSIHFSNLLNWNVIRNQEALENFTRELVDQNIPAIFFNDFYKLPLLELVEKLKQMGFSNLGMHRRFLLKSLFQFALERRIPLHAEGVLDSFEGEDILVFAHDNYQIKEFSVFIPKILAQACNLRKGDKIKALIHLPVEGDSCPCALSILSVMDGDPKQNVNAPKFSDLIPYYPLQRILLEHNHAQDANQWDNLSMRVVDLLAPIGLGQRGLIVAPPRTGKTILLQNIAHSIACNSPEAHLIVLLIDERPEEVTDFKRKITSAEIISSTFDEPAEHHVHAAEVVIEKARRMVEMGQHVVILLDSITRLSRAYNAMMPNSGKILSGGIESTALQGPKRFFGSARNIEGGGSLTILATALIDTGSKMDDVIFEEFKGTGNMELHLDRELADKRIFPSIDCGKSGTRKEELIYHPEEMNKIYSLRRAIHSSTQRNEAMELIIQRLKKTKTNAEFLMGINR